MQLTNTLTGALEEFVPLDAARVGIYVCGPTVYDVPHIGHARAAVSFDILRRHLVWRGYSVLFVRNVTDVDDKIIHRAQHDGVDFALVAEKYTRVYDDAMERLGVLPPDIAPRATGHIIEMIEMISVLIEREHAYVGGDSVWFAVDSMEGYGKLSGRSLDDMRAGEDPADGKRNPMDFALWKGAKDGEPSWGSPWGRGRPGWHIECSAMSARYLGVPFDIHGGGADLIFPHHENEIAQAECALGVDPFARYWVHNGHVQIDGEKMSKSLRNYVLVEEVLKDHPWQVLRLFLSTAHYRSQINYSPDSLVESAAVWDRLSTFLRSGEIGTPDPGTLEEFGQAMDDDLNTPRALAVLHGAVAEGNVTSDAPWAASLRGAVASALALLGCEFEPAGGTALVAPLVSMLLDERELARESRDFGRADRIRDGLLAAGVKVEDSVGGPRWFVG